jgi:hypothetical protein
MPFFFFVQPVDLPPVADPTPIVRNQSEDPPVEGGPRRTQASGTRNHQPPDHRGSGRK